MDHPLHRLSYLLRLLNLDIAPQALKSWGYGACSCRHLHSVLVLHLLRRHCLKTLHRLILGGCRRLPGQSLYDVR